MTEFEKKMIEIETEKLKALNKIESIIYESFFNGGVVNKLVDIKEKLEDIEKEIIDIKEIM